MNDTTFSCSHFSNSHSFLSAGKQSEMSKRSQESSPPGSPTAKARACCLVSRESVSVGQDYSSNPKSPGSTRDSQVRTWEERSAKSGWYSVHHALGNRKLQNLKDFNSMRIFPNNGEILPSDRDRNHYVTTILEEDGWRKRTSMCKEYTAPRNREDSRPCASVDAEKEIGPVSKIGIATVIDVPGIEVQVPSLSSSGYSVWILESRGHERFVTEIHRQFIVTHEGRKPH